MDGLRRVWFIHIFYVPTILGLDLWSLHEQKKKSINEAEFISSVWWVKIKGDCIWCSVIKIYKATSRIVVFRLPLQKSVSLHPTFRNVSWQRNHKLLHFKTRTGLKWKFSSSCRVGYLLGAAFKHHILLALVQPPLPHCPEVKNSVLPLQQLVQDIW